MIRFLVKNQETCQYVLLPLYGATSPVYATATTSAETMLWYSVLVQIQFIVHQTVIISSDLVTITDPPKQSSDS